MARVVSALVLIGACCTVFGRFVCHCSLSLATPSALGIAPRHLGGFGHETKGYCLWLHWSVGGGVLKKRDWQWGRVRCSSFRRPHPPPPRLGHSFPRTIYQPHACCHYSTASSPSHYVSNSSHFVSLLVPHPSPRCTCPCPRAAAQTTRPISGTTRRGGASVWLGDKVSATAILKHATAALSGDPTGCLNLRPANKG